MDLSAARGALSRAAQLIDERREDIPALFAEAQGGEDVQHKRGLPCRHRALTLTGGAGYRSGHPLARAYRDVRAGAFHHPLGANRAYDLVGRVALGAGPGDPAQSPPPQGTPTLSVRRRRSRPSARSR